MNTRLPHRSAMLLLAAFGCFTCTIPANAKFMVGKPVPVKQLLQHFQELLQKNPRDAYAAYALARVESAQFALGDPSIRMIDDHLDTRANPSPATKRTSANINDADSGVFLSSVRHYQLATSLAPDNGIAWFGFGFMCEEATRYSALSAPVAQLVGYRGKQDAVAVKRYLVDMAKNDYRKAIKLCIADDTRAMIMDVYTSQEAAKALIDLINLGTPTRSEYQEILRLQQQIRDVNSTKRGITPILIPENRHASLASLTCGNRSTKFDLSGAMAGELWPWVAPQAGLLCWDPKHTGKIQSGLDLFGSVTWWMFWKSGYDALAALDTNHDGWLTGKELEGICIWFDRNGNGISDPGEVVSLSSVGITGISVHASGHVREVHESPCNLAGIRYSNGEIGPSYDWTVDRLRPTLPSAPTLHHPAPRHQSSQATLNAFTIRCRKLRDTNLTKSNLNADWYQALALVTSAAESIVSKEKGIRSDQLTKGLAKYNAVLKRETEHLKSVNMEITATCAPHGDLEAVCISIGHASTVRVFSKSTRSEVQVPSSLKWMVDYNPQPTWTPDGSLVLVANSIQDAGNRTSVRIVSCQLVGRQCLVVSEIVRTQSLDYNHVAVNRGGITLDSLDDPTAFSVSASTDLFRKTERFEVRKGKLVLLSTTKADGDMRAIDRWMREARKAKRRNAAQSAFLKRLPDVGMLDDYTTRDNPDKSRTIQMKVEGTDLKFKIHPSSNGPQPEFIR